MVTLAQIAEEAGVSTFTVSCALRDRGRVAVDTAVRIRRIAEELGYVPSAAGRILAEGRKRTRGRVGKISIAVIKFHSELRKDLLQEEKEMIELGREKGYLVQVVNFGDFDSPRQLSAVLRAQGVQGLILLAGQASTDFRMEDMRGMAWNHFSLVKISRGIDDLRCNAVRISTFSQAKMALERIVQAGYRRIGVLMLSKSASWEDDFSRLGAVRAFQHVHAREIEKFELMRLDVLTNSIPCRVERWIERFQPDVILAFPVVWRVWLEMAGYRIPRDFAVVGLPVSTEEKSLSGVKNTGPLEDLIGQIFPVALEMLHGEICAGRTGLPSLPMEHILPVIWQDGVTMPGIPVVV